ncbi:Protein of unknown function [Cotesia congregata]|uniref:Uncharacterized protein n=1 Tax=Cotesia congregata TaxID=51543 RepID=A0A8J2MRL2_COTCN|nr:Protein of unknown function [Cotesia congregata]
MYVLVLYQDEIWHVCPLKNVSTVRKKCMVKYSDNKKYAARVMAICHDKMILTGIMKNIHGTTNHMQGVWELENIPSKSFSQVSKDFSKDVKEHVLFIDENLFKKSLSDNLIQCFNFDQDINIYKFVLKQPRFKRIKRVNEENTSQESMLKSMAKNLSDDEISPTSADKCSPSKIIRNDDDKIQESMSKSMAKDFPDDEIPPISANECSPPKVTVNDENTSQESMLKSMAKNLSDDEISPTSADKCSPSKIIINDDDTIQESMSKSMTKDAPDDEIPLISADEYSPSKVKSLDAPSDFSKFSPSNLHTEQKNRCIEEPKMLAKTNIIQSNIVEDESLSVTIDKSLQLNPPILEAASNFLILQAIGNPTFNSTLKEGCNPVVICSSDAEQKENSIRYLNIPEKLCIVDPSIDHGTNLLSAISGPRPSEFLISHDSPELQATGQLILINNVQEGLSLLNLSHSDVQQKCQGQLESKFSIDQSSTEEKIFVNLSEISHKQTIESSGYDKTYTVHESDNPKNCNELHQIFNGTLQNTIQGSFIELTEEPINHSLLDLNLEISQLSQVLKLNNGISKFSLINNEVNLPKYHTLEQGIANSHGINGQTIARITEKTTISENIEPEKDNSKEKIKPKIVSEEKVCIKLPKKRKYDDTNSGLQNLETKMKRRKQKKEIEREAKENEEKEPEEEDKAARGVESYFGESGDDEDEYKPDSNEESSESEYDENHEFQDDDELDADLRTEQTFSDSLNDTITVDQNSKALRLLGRLLVAIKSLNSHITSFTHIFQPRHYDFLIEAVKKVASRINQSSLKFDNSAPKTWTDEAKSTVLSAFKRHLENGNVPSGKEMQELINTHDCFKGRSVPQMRSWLHTYKKK